MVVCCESPISFLHPIQPVYILNSDSFRKVSSVLLSPCCPMFASLLAADWVARGSSSFPPQSLVPAPSRVRQYRKLITHNDSLVSITHYRNRQTAGWSNQPLWVWMTPRSFVYSRKHTQHKGTQAAMHSLPESVLILTCSWFLFACTPFCHITWIIRNNKVQYVL